MFKNLLLQFTCILQFNEHMQEATVLHHTFNPAGIKAPAVSNTDKSIIDYAEKEAKVLYSFQTIFPLDPFPAKVSIQPSTISIVNDLFGISKKLITVSMDDVFTIEVESGIFFATLKIQQSQPILPIIEIPYIWKEQAMKARRIMQGLLIVRKKELEIHDMKPDELLPYLEEIGSTHTWA